MILVNHFLIKKERLEAGSGDGDLETTKDAFKTVKEELKKKLDETQRVHDEYIIQRMLDGGIGKIKYAEGAYYTIQFDYEKNLQYLVRLEDNNMTPMDFDVEDFRMNRPAKRIEFVYTRGNKKVMSMNLDGSDKRELDRTILYPENEK